LIDQFTIRSAGLEDFTFCERLYFNCTGWIIEALNLDVERQHQGFALQWRFEQVRVTMVVGEDAGWLQTAPLDDAIFLGQLYLAGRFQRQGVGTSVLRMLIAEAEQARKAVVLGVVKINPARRLYERLGFRLTHEDQHKVYLRREPGLDTQMIEDRTACPGERPRD